MPLYAAGRSTEPAVWLPSANGTSRAATPAAEPLLEPPGVRSADHGLRVRDGSAYANWVVTILPSRIAPARLRRATGSASTVGMRSMYGRKPAEVRRPAV